jgi:hypothetical protein
LVWKKQSSQLTFRAARFVGLLLCLLGTFPLRFAALSWTGRMDRPSHQSTARALAQGVASDLPANRRQNNF